MGRVNRFAALGAAAALAVVAAPSVSAAAKGSPIRVMVMGIGTGGPAAVSAAAFSTVNTVVTGAADAVNAHGGIHGHHIQVDFCFDQANPNLSEGCARKAVSNGDVAVIAPLDLNGDNILPILQKADIPYVGNAPTAPDTYTNPDSYPLEGGEPADYGGEGVLLAQHGCKKIGIIYATQVNTAAGVPWITKGAEGSGASVVAKVSVSETATSFSAPVAQVESSGADCVGVAIGPSQGPPLALAVAQSGKHLTIGGITASFPNSLLANVGAPGNGLLLSGGEALPSDTTLPQIKKMLSVTKKYDAKGPQPASNFAVAGWAATEVLFDHALPAISGNVTGAKVASAMHKLKDVVTGVTGPYTGSAKPPIATDPRLLNYDAYNWKVENGVPKLLSKHLISTAPALKKASGKS